MHHHDADDWDWLEHELAELRAGLVGYDAMWLCSNCGRRIWLDALDGIEEPPICCSWEMVGTPAMRKRP